MASSLNADDPITNSSIWRKYLLNGTPCPGVIAIDGIKGFRRETEWDTKKGKGQRGATLTITQYPLARGSITVQLWKSEHFAAWNAFVPVLLTYQSGKAKGTSAAQIDHPALALLGIAHVVVAAVHPLRHVGKQMYHATVDYIEWTPPPKSNVVTTPKASAVTAPDLPGDNPPDMAAAQAAHYQASAAHAAAAARRH